MSQKSTKKALVIEGGGIRSAYVAGVLCALKDQGITDFDMVVGTSAGACCGANFVSGEVEKNRHILEDYLTGNRFVRLSKVFSRENIVDIDFLIDDICNGLVPLNIPKIKSSKTILYITALDYHTGQTVYFNSRDHDIHEALRASCAMPYLYRKKVHYDGRRLVDGGMTESIPVKKAIDEGATELVVIGSREKGYRKPVDRLPNWLHRMTYPDSPIMEKAFRERSSCYNNILDLIQVPPAGVKIHFIAPTQKMPVSRTTRSRDKVVAACDMGYQDGLKFSKMYT